jgi:hypothetical protein
MREDKDGINICTAAKYVSVPFFLRSSLSFLFQVELRSRIKPKSESQGIYYVNFLLFLWLDLTMHIGAYGWSSSCALTSTAVI